MSRITNIEPLHPGIVLDDTPAAPRRRAFPKYRAVRVERWQESWPFGELPPEALARSTGASVRTARRWVQRRRMPEPMRRLACLTLFGDLSVLNEAWSGWRIERDLLHPASGLRPYTPAELEFMPFTAQRVGSLESTVRKLTVERDDLARLSKLTAAERLTHDELTLSYGQASALLSLSTALLARTASAAETTGGPTPDEAGKLMNALTQYVAALAKARATIGVAS